MTVLTIHPLTADRIEPCISDLCALDRAELDAAGIADADALMRESLSLCEWAHEARWNGEPIAIFGVRAWPEREAGIPWMLTMNHMTRAQARAVASAATDAVARMRNQFPRLMNVVHRHNARAIRFVQWLGFHVEPDLIGPGKEFRLFSWSKNV